MPVTYLLTLIETVDSKVLPKHLGWRYGKSRDSWGRGGHLSPGAVRVSYREDHVCEFRDYSEAGGYTNEC